MCLNNYSGSFVHINTFLQAHTGPCTGWQFYLTSSEKFIYKNRRMLKKEEMRTAD